MNKRHLYVLVGTLTLLSIGLFVYKALVLEFPLRPGEEAYRWDLEARVQFMAQGGPARVWLMIPTASQELFLVDERFVSRGYGVNTERSVSGRKISWTKRQASGEQVLYY